MASPRIFYKIRGMTGYEYENHKIEGNMTEAIFGFIGVIIGAILAPAIEWFRSSQTNKKNAQFLAIHVICILDEFVNKCCEVAGDTGIQRPDGTLYFRSDLPKIVAFPENLDWKAIDHKLMYRILNFPNTIQDAFEYLSHCYQENGPHEPVEERRHEFLRLGIQACELAQDLRKEYNIPKDDKNFRNPDWDDLKHLKETREKIEEEYPHMKY